MGRSDASLGGHPGFDMVIQALHGLSLRRTDDLLRFCGFRPGDQVPDVNTLWGFREALIRAETLEDLFARLDQAISAAGHLPMGGQIVDARWWPHPSGATPRRSEPRSRQAGSRRT